MFEVVHEPDDHRMFVPPPDTQTCSWWSRMWRASLSSCGPTTSKEGAEADSLIPRAEQRELATDKYCQRRTRVPAYKTRE